MPALADTADLIAPDLPGFGFTETTKEYDFTFATMSRTIERFLDALGIGRFFVYLHDFGAAVGYPIALRNPERILGLIVQNGNAHPEGLGPAWDTAKAYWADPCDENRAQLPDWLNFEGTRDQYVGGVPDCLTQLFAPESWHLDDAFPGCRTGNKRMQ